MYKPVTSAYKYRDIDPLTGEELVRPVPEPLTGEELARPVLDGAIIVRLDVLDIDTIDTIVGAEGKRTTLRGVLDTLDAALEQRPTADMLEEWEEAHDCVIPSALEEAWDGSKNSLTVRHLIGNACCAFFEGLSATGARDNVNRPVFSLDIGT